MQSSRVFFAIFAFVICVKFRLCYQQLTEKTTFCLKNNVNKQVSTFWREVNSHCAMDPYKLMDLYEQNEGDQGSADKCSIMLRHQVRKSLVDTCALIFEEALLLQEFRNNFEINRLEKRIFNCDPLISQAVFEQFIDAVYLFVDKSELASILFSNQNFQQMVVSLLHLNSKSISYGYSEPRLSSLMMHYIRQIQQHKQFPLLPSELKQRVLIMFKAFPSTLRSVYSSKEVRLLNIAHWEYLYAPRENGPNVMQRTPLTWIADKNSTDSDGDMTLEFDDNGNIAFGSNYDGTLCYLYVDENYIKPYFWLGKEDQETRWWQIDYYEDYLVFKNARTKQLLCATIEYDENRRYVTLTTPMSENFVESMCRWTVTPLS